MSVGVIGVGVGVIYYKFNLLLDLLDRIQGEWVIPDTYCPSTKAVHADRVCKTCELITTSKESKQRHNNYLHNEKFLKKLMTRKAVSEDEVTGILAEQEEEQEETRQNQQTLAQKRIAQGLEGVVGSVSRQVIALQLAGVAHYLDRDRIPRHTRRRSRTDGSEIRSYSHMM